MGLSQEEFAQRMNRDQGAISEYENGKRKLAAIDVPLMAEVLGVSVLYFFEGDLTPHDLDHALLTEFHQLPEPLQAQAVELLKGLTRFYQQTQTS